MLDSGHTNAIDGPQASWLSQALAARSGQQFVFPVYHYPAFGTAKAVENGLPIDHPRSVAIQHHWVSAFEPHGVTAVFENDHHTYQRTVPIRNRQRDDANGIVYLGDGVWGVEVRPVPEPGAAWWLERAESRNQLWCVDLGADGTVRLRALDGTVDVFDDVTLTSPRTRPVPKADWCSVNFA